MLYLSGSHLVRDASVVADPVEVASDTGEASRLASSAALPVTEGSNAHNAVAVVCDQGATRVAIAGRLATRGADANGVIDDVATTVHIAAVIVADNLDIHAVKVVMHTAIVVGASPARGHSPPTVVAVVAIVVAGQLHLVHQGPEVHMGSADQSNIVVQLVVVVGVTDLVTAADPVSVLSLVAEAGAVVDPHTGTIVDAVTSSQHPGVANDGTTAPPTSVEAQANNVGYLALVGWVAVGDATLDVILGHVHHTEGLVKPGGHSGGYGHSQSQEHEQLHFQFETNNFLNICYVFIEVLDPTYRLS